MTFWKGFTSSDSSVQRFAFRKLWWNVIEPKYIHSETTIISSSLYTRSYGPSDGSTATSQFSLFLFLWRKNISKGLSFFYFSCPFTIGKRLIWLRYENNTGQKLTWDLLVGLSSSKWNIISKNFTCSTFLYISPPFNNLFDFFLFFIFTRLDTPWKFSFPKSQ